MRVCGGHCDMLPRPPSGPFGAAVGREPAAVGTPWRLPLLGEPPFPEPGPFPEQPRLMTDPRGRCKGLAPLPDLGQLCGLLQLPVWPAGASLRLYHSSTSLSVSFYRC